MINLLLMLPEFLVQLTSSCCSVTKRSSSSTWAHHPTPVSQQGSPCSLMSPLHRTPAGKLHQSWRVQHGHALLRGGNCGSCSIPLVAHAPLRTSFIGMVTFPWPHLCLVTLSCSWWDSAPLAFPNQRKTSGNPMNPGIYGCAAGQAGSRAAPHGNRLGPAGDHALWQKFTFFPAS